jgi:subtilisin
MASHHTFLCPTQDSSFRGVQLNRLSSLLPLLLAVCVMSMTVTAAEAPRSSAPLGVPAGKTRVIVTVLDSADASAVIRDDNITNPRRRFTRAVNGFVADVDERQLAALDADPRVVAITPDARFSFPNAQKRAARQPSTQIVTNPMKRVGLLESPTARVDGRDNGGLDVDIAVVDSGVDNTHPDLRVVGGINCADSSSPFDDVIGHGTFVAGLAAAKDNSIGIVGVAPGARIWAVKLDDYTGRVTLESFMCSLEWLVTNAGTIEVANMSLGIDGTVDGECGMVRRYGRHARWQKWELVDPYNMAICKIVAARVTIVAAAGNGAMDASTTLPGAYPETIAVSALADHDGKPGGRAQDFSCWPEQIFDDGLASFSNFGQVIDFAAPGICQISTFPGNRYVMGDGTSFSTPMVAGAAALLAARYPRANPAQIRQMLKANAERWRMPNDPDNYHESILSVRGF